MVGCSQRQPVGERGAERKGGQEAELTAWARQQQGQVLETWFRADWRGWKKEEAEVRGRERQPRKV